ncbi:MAG: nucleotidyltransferase domain-containing protein [Candidatus Methanoperedens sp.]|nr:nucleotidyltransferase domain-containing protein [Candidatus Methanoperedens sp.]MCZ7360870.1 nucleotidyltransferase domain-containing protein [Candidatus Methanoperedens sp.]HLB70252.1 nucleotidyltransferase domain-containing protein [Candidatus Methanoperedens sp.]
MEDGIQTLYLNYANLIANKLEEILQDDLISVALFGSASRGEAGEGSDIDLLIVAEKFGTGGRFEVFNEIERDLKASDEYRKLKEKRFGTLISPVPLTPSEVETNPIILLDIVTDGIILYDVDDFIENKMKSMRKKLKKMGSKRIFLDDKRYYWDLKPDYKLGEVVEI